MNRKLERNGKNAKQYPDLFVTNTEWDNFVQN